MPQIRRALILTILFLALSVFVRPHVYAEQAVGFDFTSPADAKAWQPTHDIAALEPTSEGLVIRISGDDPYTFGPRRDFPEGQALWMTLRLRPEVGGMAQLFYFKGAGPDEANSARFYVKGGEWTDVRVPLPALGSHTGLRFDPPGDRGVCVVSRMAFSLRPRLEPPAWLAPDAANFGPGAREIESGALRLRHGAERFGGFAIEVDGQPFAIGHNHSQLSYIAGGRLHWIELTNRIDLSWRAGGLVAKFRTADSDGGHWAIEQVFRPSKPEGAFDVETTLEADRYREVVYAPILTLLSGVGSFGTNKTQALLAGVEYLENEPSSSEADAIGDQAKRQAPDSYKITFPLMALANRGRYIGLIWEAESRLAAFHDTPDRIFRSGGHAMGLMIPGASPGARDVGSLLPYEGVRLAAGQRIRARATIIGGRGETVVPAVQQYVARRGLPVLPKPNYDAAGYNRLAAHGWLDSKIRDGALFRHAVGGNFGAGPTADAAVDMIWLKDRVGDFGLSNRLAAIAVEAASKVSPESYNGAQVGHIRTPLPALVLGAVLENADAAARQGRSLLASFGPDGTVTYAAPQKGQDLGRTHWTRHANGLTAARLAVLLQDAAFSGDPELIREGLSLTELFAQYRNGVPRGAQTWEVPLHTPDILASAYAVQCYTIAYELNADPRYLDEARYWAWAGVPFVYLSRPADGPVGLYATTPVLGATEFVAPMWIGLPVQWCGLVYADAIRRFSRYDPKGPWGQIADGIAASGIQQTHPLEDASYQGLLPDSFNLVAQFRNPVPINPATLFPEAVRYYGGGPLYDFREFPIAGLRVHAPGAINVVGAGKGFVEFTVEGWPEKPYYILINGIKVAPKVWIDGRDIALTAPQVFQASSGRLVLSVSGRPRVKIEMISK
jgi:hypothetical protein